MNSQTWMSLSEKYVAHTYNRYSLVLVKGKGTRVWDVEGVKDEKGELIATLDAKRARRLIAQKVISSGMIPKVNCCLEALEGGVTKTHIIDGRVEHAILLEMFTDVGIGTQIYKET